MAAADMIAIMAIVCVWTVGALVRVNEPIYETLTVQEATVQAQRSARFLTATINITDTNTVPVYTNITVHPTCTVATECKQAWPFRKLPIDAAKPAWPFRNLPIDASKPVSPDKMSRTSLVSMGQASDKEFRQLLWPSYTEEVFASKGRQLFKLVTSTQTLDVTIIVTNMIINPTLTTSSIFMSNCLPKDTYSKIAACPPCSGFQCDNRKCLNSSSICNGIKDCDDNSDENYCVLPGAPCGGFLCGDNETCLPDYYKCDGEDDCGDNSDEVECVSCAQTICNGDNTECFDDNGNQAGVCRCQDGYITSEPVVTTETDCIADTCTGFLCGDKKTCLPDSFKCDGDNDCEDASDEVGCGCIGFTCVQDSKCIQNSWKCDGEFDCDDSSDEMDCGTDSCGGFLCVNEGLCIPTYWRCDDIKDCKDNSDERNCYYTRG